MFLFYLRIIIHICPPLVILQLSAYKHNNYLEKKTMLVIKHGYMFRLILSHPQANMVTGFRYIKCAPN